MQQPPPVWLKDWAQLLIVQVVALVTAVYGLWRFLTHKSRLRESSQTKRITANRKLIIRRARELRKAIDGEGAAIRTILQNEMGKLFELERKLEAMQSAHDYTEEAHLGEVEGIKKELVTVREAIGAANRRLASIDGRLSRIEGYLQGASGDKPLSA